MCFVIVVASPLSARVSLLNPAVVAPIKQVIFFFTD